MCPPKSTQPTPDPDARAGAPGGAIDRTTTLAGRRILVVEDMGLIAIELQHRLEALKCRVVGMASRLDEATTLARTLEMDGVLLDLNLAGLESYPVAAILRERGIPFILISGYDRDHIHANFSDAAHLKKPFTQDELAAKMATAFVA